MCGKERGVDNKFLIRGRGLITAPSSVREGKYLHMVMSIFRMRVAKSLSVITALPCVDQEFCFQ